MPAVSASNATWNTTAGNKGVAPTPAVGDLLVAFVAESGLTTGYAISDGQPGGTYTQIGSFALNNTSVDSIGVWVRDALVASAVVHAINTTGATASTGGGPCVIQVTGMTRAGLAAVRSVAGVRQFTKQENQAAGTPAPVFPAAPLSANTVLGAILTASNSTTNTAPPTGWTELQDRGYNTPPTGLEVASRDSGETGTTITWTAATPSIFASIIIELEAGVPDAELIASEPNYNGLGRVSAFLDDEDAEHYDYYAPLHNATEAFIAGPPAAGVGIAELVAADPNYSGAPRIGATLDDVDDEPYDYYGGSAPVVDTTLIIAPRMQTWIDFGDPSLLFTDTGRTTPVASAGDPIRGVTDKSGNGLHLSQPTNPPTYQPNAYRGLSTSRWDGTAQNLHSATVQPGIGYPQPITRIAVVRSTEIAAASRVAIGGLSASDPAGPWTNGGNWSAWAATPQLSDGFQDTALHVITHVFNGAASSIALEGIVKVTGTTGTGIVTQYEVGSYNSGTQLWLGDVCEFIDFQGILDPADLAFWTNYMVTRWSVLTEVEFTPDQYPYETEPEHDYYSPLYDGAVDAFVAGPPVAASDAYIAALDLPDHTDQPDEDEAWDFYGACASSLTVDGFLAPHETDAFETFEQTPGTLLTAANTIFGAQALSAGRAVASNELFVGGASFDASVTRNGSSNSLLSLTDGYRTHNRFFQRFNAAVSTIGTKLGFARWDPANGVGPYVGVDTTGHVVILNGSAGQLQSSSLAITAERFFRVEILWTRKGAASAIDFDVVVAIYLDPTASVADETISAIGVDGGGVASDVSGPGVGLETFGTGQAGSLGVWIDDYAISTKAFPAPTGTAAAPGAIPSRIANASWFEQETAYQADPDEEHHNWYAQRFDGSVEAFIAGPPAGATDEYVATIDVPDASDQPDEDDVWDYYDPFIDGAEAVLGFLTVEDEIAEAAQLDRSVGQDDDQAWLAGDPTDVAPFIDGAEAILGFLTVKDEIAEAAQLPRDIGWFPEDFEQANDPTDITPFLDEQEELIAGPPLFADDGYVATVDVFDHSDEPAPDDAFDYYATTQEGTEWLIGFLTVEDEIAEAAQLDRSVGQDDDQAWVAEQLYDWQSFAAFDTASFFAVKPSVTNTFEGGTNGVAISAANSGGASGDAFNQTFGATYASAQSAHGGLSATGSAITLNYTGASLGQLSEFWGRAYCYFTARTGSGFTPIFIGSNSAVGQIAIDDTGHIRIYDNNATPVTSTTVVPLNSWFRVEFHFLAATIAGSDGLVEAKLFLNPDSLTPDEVITFANADTGSGVRTWSLYSFDPDVPGGQSIYLDDLNLNIFGYPGPAQAQPSNAEAQAFQHVESVAQDFPERIDDTEEQSVETAHVQPEEYIAGSTLADDPLYLAQTYFEQDIENAPAPDDAFDYSAAAGFVSTFPAYVPEPPQLRYDFDAFTLGLADGAPVGTWADASGRGSDAVQPTGSLQPLYVAAAINGHPAVRGDGTDDNLPVTNYTPDLQAWTIMAVVAPEVGDATSEDVIVGGAAPGNSWFVDRVSFLGIPANAAIGYRTSSALGNLTGGSAGIWPDRQGKLVTFIYDPAAGRSLFDGLVQVLAPDGDTTHSDPPTSMFLFSRSGPSLFFQGLIGQVRIWNYVLDPATRAIEQQALLTKWFDVADEVAEGQVTDDQASPGHYEWPPDATNEQPWLDQSEAFIAGPPIAADEYVATTALVPDASDQPAPDEAFDFYAYPIEASEWFIGFTAPDAEIAEAAQDRTIGQDDDQLWTLNDPTDAAPFVDGIEYLTGFLVPADEIAQAAQPHYGDWQDWRETEQTEDYANDATIGVEAATPAPDAFDVTIATQLGVEVGQDWHLWPEWDYTADQPYASELDVAPLTFPADPDEVTQAAQPTAIGQDDDALWTLTDPTDIAPFTEQAEGFVAGPPDAFDTTIATQPDPSMGQDTDLLNPPDLSQLDTGYIEQAEGYVAGPPAFAPDAETIASQPAETGIDVESRWPEWDGTDATPFLDGAEWFIGFTVPDVEITIAAQPSRAEDTAVDNPDRIEWTEETDPATTLDLSPLVRPDDPIEVTYATQLDSSVGQDDDQWWTLLDPTDTTPFIDEQEEAIAGSTTADDPIYAAQTWPDLATTEYAPEETQDYANDTALDLSPLTFSPDAFDLTIATQLDPSVGQDDDQGWIAADPTDIWPFTDQLEAFEEIVLPDEGIAATQDYSDRQSDPESEWAPESLADGSIEVLASLSDQATLAAAGALSEPAAEPEDEAWPIYLALPDQSGEFAATQLDIALVAALDVPAALVDEPEVWTPEVALSDAVEQLAVTAEIAVMVAAQPTFDAYDWTTFEEPVADLSTIERRPIVAKPTAQPEIVDMTALVDPGVDLVALKDPEVGFPTGGGFSSGFSSGFQRGGGSGELDALAESEGYAMGPYGAPAPDHVSALEGEVEQIDALSDPEVDVT